MSVISKGISFGNMVVNSDYIMTRSQIQGLEDAEGYPELFPIWCSDDNKLYIYYKTENGVPKIAAYDEIITDSTNTCFYPTVDPETNQISWTIRQLTGEVPAPVTLTGEKGDSAYEVWINEGNEGSQSDFLASLVPDMSNLTESQIAGLKTALGLDDIDTALAAINSTLDGILG